MVDKNTIQQVLGCLMQHPQYLSEVDKYSLDLTDFTTKFEKYIFTAINNLYRSGASVIEPIDIENYLDNNDVAKTVFKQNNGVEFLQDIKDFSHIDSFQYYYDKLKKLNLLKDLKKQGFDISEFYCNNPIDINSEEINRRFEAFSAKDICEAVKRKIIGLEAKYAKSEEVEVTNAATGIREFIYEMNENMEIGAPIQGHIYNKVFSGAQKGALTVRSGSSGLGKTRCAVADACYLAYPIRYDSYYQRWEQLGSNEKVLFIITEQTVPQIKKMILAYLSDINEGRFKMGNFNEDEMARLEYAAEIMEQYAENMVILKVPNPTIELIKSLVRENCLTKDIGYVFYDYIFIGPALLNEFRGFTLRNDEILLMFTTALKDLAVELNVAMFTATQVNANADDNKNIRSEATLAGGRSTINKADNGAIMARPSKEELEILEPLADKYGIPNVVTDIFKCRSGEWTQVRIWSIMDLGRMKRRDLFITDARLDVIEGFFNDDTNYEVHFWEDEEEMAILQFVKELNDRWTMRR